MAAYRPAVLRGVRGGRGVDRRIRVEHVEACILVVDPQQGGKALHLSCMGVHLRQLPLTCFSLCGALALIRYQPPFVNLL